MRPLPGNFRKTVSRYIRAPRSLKSYAVAVGIALVLSVSGIWLVQAAEDTRPVQSPPKSQKTTAAAKPKQSKPATPPPAATATPPKPAPQIAPPVVAQRKLLFGIGPQADSAQAQRLTAESPVRMLTSWYNGPGDLGFMRGWQDDRIPNAYAAGYSLHLVVWSDKPETDLTTKYGPACGREYPLSDRFASDMRELATIYRGAGTLYVSMFSELQTFPCQDNTWQGSENYYRALMDQYRLARDLFKTHAPNSQVSLTWGGWQAQWDDPGRGGGSSLIPHFADVLNISDFQSFQAMGSEDNVRDISAMTKLLHRYGNGRVMIAHYKPDNGSQATWNRDMTNIFTASNVDALTANGLFAFSFMDGHNLNANEASYQQAKNIVLTYGQ